MPVIPLTSLTDMWGPHIIFFFLLSFSTFLSHNTARRLLVPSLTHSTVRRRSSSPSPAHGGALPPSLSPPLPPLLPPSRSNSSSELLCCSSAMPLLHPYSSLELWCGGLELESTAGAPLRRAAPDPWREGCPRHQLLLSAQPRALLMPCAPPYSRRIPAGSAGGRSAASPPRSRLQVEEECWRPWARRAADGKAPELGRLDGERG